MDSLGNSGEIRAGEVQMMGACSGIVHDEMRDHPGGAMHGFQLWINLFAADKMSAPWYEHISAETLVWRDLKAFGSRGARVKIISGALPVGENAEPAASPVKRLAVPVLYADVDIAAGGEATIAVPAEPYDTAIVYVYGGGGLILGGGASGGSGASGDEAPATPVQRMQFALLAGDGGAIKLVAGNGAPGLQAMVLAGKKIKEPIARRGPFVMNTQQEVNQAFDEYFAGTLVKTKADVVTY
jgi:hypothetical protein